jgi:predicted metalloprotease with PDZ domain
MRQGKEARTLSPRQRIAWTAGAAAVWLVVALCPLPAPAEDTAERAWLGIFVADAVDGGAELVAVVPGGPADRAGLRPGDVLVQAASRPIDGVADLTGVLDGLRPGDRLAVQLLRGGAVVERVVPASRRSSGSWVGAPIPSPLPPRPPTRAGMATLPACSTLGIAVAELTPDLRVHLGAPPEAGLLVADILPDTPAERSGLQVGDLIVELDSEPVRDLGQLEGLLRTEGSRPSPTRAAVVREGRPRVVSLRWHDETPGGVGADVTAPGRAAARPVLERTIVAEIERLEARVAELRRALARLQRETGTGEAP